MKMIATWASCTVWIKKPAVVWSWRGIARRSGICKSNSPAHTAGRRIAPWLLVARAVEDTLTGKIGRGRDGRRAVVRDAQPGKSAETRFRSAALASAGLRLRPS